MQAPARPIEAAPTALPAELVVDPAAIATLAGAFRLPDPKAITALAARPAWAIGPVRVTALGGLLTLVGMFVPGLPSVLSKIEVTLTDEVQGLSFAYAVKRFRPMLQSVTIEADGQGTTASIEDSVRPRPEEQENLDALAAPVQPGAFSDVTALIIWRSAWPSPARRRRSPTRSAAVAVATEFSAMTPRGCPPSSSNLWR